MVGSAVLKGWRVKRKKVLLLAFLGHAQVGECARVRVLRYTVFYTR